MGVGDMPWSDYFGMFLAALNKGDVFISQDGDEALLTVWCTHQDKQLANNFDLHQRGR